MKFEVDTSSLNNTVQQMQAELTKIEQAGKNLYSALEALEGMWEGTAHDTFAIQYRNDQEMLDKMKKTISNVIKDMGEARMTYEQCEQSVETEIRKIAI